MTRFRKKPIEIEAIQWDGNYWDGSSSSLHNIRELNLSVNVVLNKLNRTLEIATLEGRMLALVGDWIIKGIKGELYPCKPDIFEKTYEQCNGIKHLGAKE